MIYIGTSALVGGDWMKSLGLSTQVEPVTTELGLQKCCVRGRYSHATTSHHKHSSLKRFFLSYDG